MDTIKHAIGSTIVALMLCGILLSALATPLFSAPPVAFAAEIPEPPQGDGRIIDPELNKEPSGSGCGITNLPRCLWDFVMENVGALLISTFGWLVVATGSLFDWIFYFLVIDFSGTLTQKLNMTDGIERAWMAFRDIANILIIGILVYIAINIILGTHEFGDKKLIGRVIMVAVLMNFSLFFARFIIDVSNLAAGQFYRSMVESNMLIQNKNAASPSQQWSLANAYLAKAGFASFADTKRQLEEINKRGNAFYVVMAYSLVAVVLMVALAAVFLYGVFLLLSRAILLVMLMVTASIAFASHLIPSWSSATYGWDKWWKNLLDAALFGPFLTVMLYISLLLLQGARPGSIGDAVGSAQQGKSADWTSVLLFALVIGFLYVSFKLSSFFASSISYMSMTAKIPNWGMGFGARILGALSRQTVGRGSSRVGNWLQEKARNKDSFMARMIGQNTLDAAAQFAKKGAKRDFNLLNTGLGKEFRKLSGLKGKMGGETDIKGFSGSESKRAEAFAEKGERLTLTKDEKTKITEEALKAAAVPHESNKQILEGMKPIAEANLAAIDAANKASRDAVVQRQEGEHTRLMAALQTARSAGNIQQMRNVQTQIDAQKTAHQEELRQEDARIAHARQASARQLESINNSLTQIQQTVATDADAIATARGAKREAKDVVKDLAHRRLTNIVNAAIGKGIENLSPDSMTRKIIRGMTGANTKDGKPVDHIDDRLARAAEGQVSERKKKKDAKLVADILKDQGAAPPPPPAPPAGGGTP